MWATPGQRGFPTRNNASSSSSGARAVATASTSYSAAAASLPSAPSYAPPASSQSIAGVRRVVTGPTAAQSEAQRKQQEAFTKAAELRQILNSLDKVDDQGRRSSLLDTLCSTDDVLKLPVHSNPPSIQSGDLRVDLLKHQVRQPLVGSVYYGLIHDDFRHRPSNGVLTANIPVCLRKKAINQSNFGN